MNASEFLDLDSHRDPANADIEHEPFAGPLGFIATLHRIGAGAAADGQPWPDTSQSIGRCIALADADCALAGLRAVQEMVLAAERTRQTGADGEYLGDRMMEGLMMACVALTAQVTERLQGRG